MIWIATLIAVVFFIIGVVAGIYISHRGMVKPVVEKIVKWAGEDVTVERTDRPMATRRDPREHD